MRKEYENVKMTLILVANDCLTASANVDDLVTNDNFYDDNWGLAN